MYRIIQRQLKRATQRLRAEYHEAKQFKDLMLSYKLELRQQAEQARGPEKDLKALNRLSQEEGNLTFQPLLAERT